MNRIILSFVVLVFVQLVNGQVPTQACVDATTALGTNTACTTAFATATDATVLCMGTCRDLFDDIINNCGATIAGAYSTLLSTLCTPVDPCETASNAVSQSCADSFGNGDGSVCTGTCGAQLSAVATACASSTDSDAQDFLTAYNLLCGSGTACTAATTAFLAVADTCDPETVSASVLCNGQCRTLADAVVNACPGDNELTNDIRAGVNQLCGSGNMLKASGVITLLIVAICALIF